MHLFIAFGRVSSTQAGLRLLWKHWPILKFRKFHEHLSSFVSLQPLNVLLPCPAAPNKQQVWLTEGMLNRSSFIRLLA